VTYGASAGRAGRAAVLLTVLAMAAASCGSAAGSAKTAVHGSGDPTISVVGTATTAPPGTTAPAVATTQPPGKTTTAPGSIPVTTAGSTPTTAVKGSPPVVALTDTDNGKSIVVPRGDSISVVLHSTYWSMQPPSNAMVLAQQGAPVVAPQLQGCVPGQGCGTVTTDYLANSAGQAQLWAHRQTCGEALRCMPDQQDWRVTVTVS